MVRIHKIDFRYLESILSPFAFSFMLKGDFERENYTLYVPQEALEVILDELSSILIKQGLGPDDEPNALGYRIEGLINVFSGELYD